MGKSDPDNDELFDRTIYNELTLEIIAGIPDDELEMAVVDYVTYRLPRSYPEWVEVFRGLSVGFRAVYATWVLEGEINNGGLSQFFFNSSALIAYDARDGCIRIGALDIGSIVEEAIALEKAKGTPSSQFPETGAPPGQISDLHDYADFEHLDDRFFGSTENLSALRIRYIRSHPEEFIGPRIN